MLRWRPNVGVMALAALAAAVVPSLAHAQIAVMPTLGFYSPLGGWTQEQDDGSGFRTLRRQLSTLMYGVRLSRPLSSTVSLQATFGAAPGQVAVSTASGTVDVNATVYVASARVVLKTMTLMDGPSHDQVHWDVLLGAGAGLVHRAGTAWENTTGVTAPALVVELGFGVGAFRLMLEDYISWAQFNGGSPTQTRARMHHDLIGTLGAAITLGGRR
jgi:hypothetical protein